MKLASDFFNRKPLQGKPQPGKLMVAVPSLEEYYFNHSVIFLLDHDDSKETLGLVMNRKMHHTLVDVLDEKLTDGIPDNIDLYCGGPVATDRLFYLHKVPELIRDSVDVGNGLYYGGNFNDVLEYLREGMPTDGLIRFFVGYSGWSKGQLKEEIETGTWAVEDVPKGFRLLEGQDASYWSGIVRRMGAEYSGWLLQPMNPCDN